MSREQPEPHDLIYFRNKKAEDIKNRVTQLLVHDRHSQIITSGEFIHFTQQEGSTEVIDEIFESLPEVPENEMSELDDIIDQALHDVRENSLIQAAWEHKDHPRAKEIISNSSIRPENT